jgi:hypothetical protein
MGDEKWQKWHEIMSLQGEEVSVEEAAGKRILRLVQALSGVTYDNQKQR